MRNFLRWGKPGAPDEQVGFFWGRSWLSVVGVSGLNGKRPRLRQNLLINTSNVINIPRKLQEVARSNGLHKLPWNLSLGWDKYAMFPREAPAVPPEETASAIRWFVRDQLDYPVEEAVVDCFDIPQQGRLNSNRKVYVVAAKREIVREYVTVVERGGLRINAIEVPELGLNNIASHLPESMAGVAMLYLPPDDQPACIQISCEDEIYLTRRIAPNSGADSFMNEDPAEALVNTVQRSLDYYQNTFHKPMPAALYLVATPSREKELLASLSSHLNIRVKKLAIDSMFAMETAWDNDNLSHILLALGAALRPVGGER